MMFEMIVKKVNVSKIGDRISQTIILEKDKEEYLLVVNKKIDLSPFKKGDKVLVTFEISRKCSLNSPYFYIKEIEKNVILIKEGEAYV